MNPVTESEVATALKRLNNNKAVDIMGLTSEHFKITGQQMSLVVRKPVFGVFNQVRYKPGCTATEDG